MSVSSWGGLGGWMLGCLDAILDSLLVLHCVGELA